MEEIFDQIRKKLVSQDIRIRYQAGEMLYGIMSPELYNYFLGWTGSPHDAEDLLSKILYELFKLLHENRYPLDKDPRYYIMRMAHNERIDHWRKHRNPKTLQDELVDSMFYRSPILHYQENPENVLVKLEETREQEAMNHAMRGLILRIPNENDRLLALFLSRLEHPNQVHVLTGWEPKKIFNGIRRIQRKLKRMLEREEAYLSFPHPWQQEMSFSNKGLLSINYLNARIGCIHPDFEPELLKDLGINNFTELQKTFTTMILLEDIESSRGDVRVCFLPRKCFSYKTLQGGELMFFGEYSAAFARVKDKTGWKEMLVLEDGIFFTGRISDPERDANGFPVGLVFHYPSLGFESVKPYDEKSFRYIKNPYTSDATIFVFRDYPSKDNIPYSPETVIPHYQALFAQHE